MAGELPDIILDEESRPFKILEKVVKHFPPETEFDLYVWANGSWEDYGTHTMRSINVSANSLSLVYNSKGQNTIALPPKFTPRLGTIADSERDHQGEYFDPLIIHVDIPTIGHQEGREKYYALVRHDQSS